jgi:hypothetical protein
MHSFRELVALIFTISYIFLFVYCGGSLFLCVSSGEHLWNIVVIDVIVFVSS